MPFAMPTSSPATGLGKSPDALGDAADRRQSGAPESRE